MRTAFAATELGYLRSRPHRAEYYLAVHQPQIIWEGNVGTIPDTYPGSAIVASGTSAGHLSNVRAGQTLLIGTGPRIDDLGKIRVRSTPSGSTLALAEFGSGLTRWQAGTCLTVLDEFRPWSIHHNWNSTASTWRVDFDPYTSQLSRYGPQAVLGPPAVLWLTGTLGGRGTASYVGDRSYTRTVGASITSQSWSFPNGETVTSVLGSSQNPIVITYLNASSFGAYHSLTVTDGNGNSHIGRRLTFAFNGSTATPVRVRFDQIAGGLRQGGYETRVYISGSNLATSSLFPDGAQAIIFERASYAGAGSSFGGNFFGRNEIVMAGWIQGESARIEPFTGEVSFVIQTINTELEKTQALDLFLESGSAASDWDMASGLDVNRAAIALTKYRSTIANVVDFYTADGNTTASLEIPFRSLPRGSLWEQLVYNYDAIGGIVAADLQSAIYAQADAQLTGGSTALPSIMDIISADRRDTVTIEKEHTDINSQYVVYAVQGGASPNPPLGAYAPGQPGGYRGTKQEISRNKVAVNQAHLITLAGNMHARDNNPYKQIHIPLAGNIRLDSVPQCRVNMSLSPGDVQNLRGLNWNNRVLLPTETRINYSAEGGFVNTEIVAEASVDGWGGSALTFPKVDTITSPSPSPSPPQPVPGGVTPADGNTVYMLTTNRIARTQNWNSDSPNWTNVTGNISLGANSFVDFILDPWSPKNRAYVADTTTVYRAANLTASPPSWTQILSSADLSGYSGTFVSFRRVKANINAENNIAVIYQTTAGGGLGNTLYLIKTTDGGSTWSASAALIIPEDTIEEIAVTAKASVRGNSQFTFDWGQRSLNVMCAPYVYQLFNGSIRSGVLRSADGGNTWGRYETDDLEVITAQNPFDLTIAYNTNDPLDQTIVYIHNGQIRFWTGEVLNTIATISTTAPSTTYKIVPIAGTGAYVWDSQDYGVSQVSSLRYTTDSGVTWTTTYTTPSNVPGAMVGLWPYDTNRIFAMQASGPISSLDGGYNFSSKLGDYSTAVTAWTPINARYGLLVVPVWIE